MFILSDGWEEKSQGQHIDLCVCVCLDVEFEWLFRTLAFYLCSLSYYKYIRTRFIACVCILRLQSICGNDVYMYRVQWGSSLILYFPMRNAYRLNVRNIHEFNRMVIASLL